MHKYDVDLVISGMLQIIVWLSNPTIVKRYCIVTSRRLDEFSVNLGVYPGSQP